MKITYSDRPEHPTEDEYELAQGGKKINAIKTYRERRHCRLLEAKNAIEQALNDGYVYSTKRKQWAVDPDSQQLWEDTFTKFAIQLATEEGTPEELMERAKELTNSYFSALADYREHVDALNAIANQ